MLITKRIAISIASTIAITTISLPAYAEAERPSFKDSVEYSKFRSVDGIYQVRASDLIGATVVNAEDDSIGEVDDLVFSSQKKSTMAILSIGGFLGMGEKLVSVPYQELRISRDGDSVYLAANQSMLEKKQAFTYYEGEPSGLDQVRGRMTDAHTVVSKRWAELKNEVSKKWSKLTYNDIDQINGDHDRLIDRIHERYEMPRREVARDVDSWLNSLDK